MTGWLVSSTQARKRETELRRETSAQRFLERQIEELYAPLLGLLEQNATMFEAEQKWKDEHKGHAMTVKVERFFFHKVYVPQNASICELIRAKNYLLEDGALRNSLTDFVKHALHWEAHFRLVEEISVDETFMNVPPYPLSLVAHAQQALDDLRVRRRQFGILEGSE